MRKMAEKRGMHFAHFSKVAENNPAIDKELDDMQKELGKQDNLVMDSRIGFYFIPNSYKIFLKASSDEAAKRIFNAKRHGEDYKDLNDAKKFIIKRMNSEKKRYKKYYGIDFPNEKDFDLVIDTTDMSINEVVEKILRNLPN
jgi:predicted cytidylate kinase